MPHPPLVNESGYKKIWCPLCQTDQPPSNHAVMWISPASKLVCYFTCCQPCVDIFLKNTKAEQSVKSTEIEERLLVKYPQLLKKLPDGYNHPPDKSFSA